MPARKRKRGPSEKRHKDVDWKLPALRDSLRAGLEPQEVQIAVLMDLRDELKEIKALLMRIKEVAR